MSYRPDGTKNVSFLKKLGKSESGNVLILFGLSMPLLIGLAGLGTDTVQWTLMKQQLQRSADSAALNGAYAKAQSKNVSDNANRDLTKTLDGFSGVGTTVQNAPTTGAFAGNTQAVRVALTYSEALPFSSLFLSNPPTISVEAVAAVLNNGDYCVISLIKTNRTGIAFSGSSKITLGCGAVSNSTGAEAVTAGGGSEVRVSPVAAVGNVPPSGNYLGATVLVPFSIPQRDPFAALPDPTNDMPSPCKPDPDIKPSQTDTINPGCYNGLNVQGTLTMNPGIYYLNGGSFKTGSKTRLTANGVTIILTGTGTDIGTIDMNGGSSVIMSAPTSGPYKGVLFYMDRDAPLRENVNKFNGGSSGSFLGAIYMPTQQLNFAGDATFKTDCLQIVGLIVEISGNTTITNNCPVGGASDSFIGTQVRLVG